MRSCQTTVSTTPDTGVPSTWAVTVLATSTGDVGYCPRPTASTARTGRVTQSEVMTSTETRDRDGTVTGLTPRADELRVMMQMITNINRVD